MSEVATKEFVRDELRDALEEILEELKRNSNDSK
jgi:hypothetical protein